MASSNNLPSIRNSSDIVTLNVGGTHYTTCVATLINYSSYFEAMFSMNWASSSADQTHDSGDNDDEIDDNEHEKQNNQNHINKQNHEPTYPVIFLDKDPIPFGYILNYMREGYISLPKGDYMLAKNIILQAQYFGLEFFISMIKYKSVENCMQYTSIFNVLDDDEVAMDEIGENGVDSKMDRYSRAFDDRYPSLSDAFEDGCLPYSYFHKYRNQILIQLSCGEKVFANKTKIIEKSEWLKHRIEDGPTFPISPEDALYIDEDPQVFKYILDYIRCSQVHMPEDDPSLFRRILSCAEVLRMDHFITIVKSRTMTGLEWNDQAPMGADPMFLDESRHALVTHGISHAQRRNAIAFDQKFGSIDAAFTEAILPKMYFFSRETDLLVI